MVDIPPSPIFKTARSDATGSYCRLRYGAAEEGGNDENSVDSSSRFKGTVNSRSFVFPMVTLGLTVTEEKDEDEVGVVLAMDRGEDGVKAQACEVFERHNASRNIPPE